MFTILWLIRSRQGMLSRNDETYWQNDWWLATMITMMFIGIDLILIIASIILLR
jgi:hypothetical protein